MSWAEVKKINSDMAKSLDTLITEKTSVKIQTVTISVPNTSGTSSTGSAELESIDSSKSIIVPISPVLTDTGTTPHITGVSYSLSNASVSATVAYYNPAGQSTGIYSLTVAVVTFGGNVS